MLHDVLFEEISGGFIMKRATPKAQPKRRLISHLDQSGRTRMVDVSDKSPTYRVATAEGRMVVGRSLIKAIEDQRTPKGNVLETARLAGIMAAKKTAELIPLCHPLPLSEVKLDFVILKDQIKITATVSARAVTGVEMEALTAVSVAALTIYDMLKALSHDITIENIRLLSKSGGKSGEWRRANG